jgi:hypothetical protein
MLDKRKLRVLTFVKGSAIKERAADEAGRHRVGKE